MYPQPPNHKPGIGFPLARITVMLSLATGACHDLAIAPYKGKGTGEKALFRKMYDTFNVGDVVLADALFDDYFIVCDLCDRGIDLVARAKYNRVGTRIAGSRPDGDLIVWQRPSKPRSMTKEQYRDYPKQLVMREVPVNARDRNNRVTQFRVITTILARSIGGRQIGDLYERRWVSLGEKTSSPPIIGLAMVMKHSPPPNSATNDGQYDTRPLKLVPFVAPTEASPAGRPYGSCNRSDGATRPFVLHCPG